MGIVGRTKFTISQKYSRTKHSSPSPGGNCGEYQIYKFSKKFPESNILNPPQVGIVGRTGAGKSSLISTLLRMVELQSGSIIIDDVSDTSYRL